MKKLVILILVLAATVFPQIIQEEIHNLTAIGLEEKIDNLFNKLEAFYSDKNISSLEGLIFKANLSSKEEKKKVDGLNDNISQADSVYDFFTYSLNNIKVLNDFSILVNAAIVLYNSNDKKEIRCDFLIHRFKESFFFDETGMIRELKGIINKSNVSNKYTESLNRINNTSFIPYPHTTVGHYEINKNLAQSTCDCDIYSHINPIDMVKIHYGEDNETDKVAVFTTDFFGRRIVYSKKNRLIKR